MLTGSDDDLKKIKKSLYWSKYFLLCFVFTIPLMFFISILAMLVGPLLAWPAAKFWVNLKAMDVLAASIKLQEKLLLKALGQPKSPAYFCVDYAWSPSAIAVDVEKGTLTAVCWSGEVTKKRLEDLPDDCLRSITYDAHEVLKWRAEEPGATIIEPLGSLSNVSTSDMMAMQRKNSAARLEQRKTTGLTIETSRLHEQEVFLNLSYDVAKKWVLLLKKFSDGELPALTTHIEFPTP